MSVRTPAATASWAKVPRAGYGGLCLKHTRMASNIPAKYPDARTAWKNAKHRHVGTSTAKIPVGAPLFMDRSSSKYGHVCTWLGNGRIGTTDSTSVKTRDDPITRWTNAGWRILGWSEDLNGVRVIPAKATSRYRATVNGLRVRTAPSTTAKVVRSMSKGDTFTVPKGSGTVTGSGHRWLKTTAGHYVAFEYTQKIS